MIKNNNCCSNENTSQNVFTMKNEKFFLKNGNWKLKIIFRFMFWFIIQVFQLIMTIVVNKPLGNKKPSDYNIFKKWFKAIIFAKSCYNCLLP